MWMCCLSCSEFVNERQSSWLTLFTFAFAPIGPWIDPLAAFASVSGHMEAPYYVYMLFFVFSVVVTFTHRIYGILTLAGR